MKWFWISGLAAMIGITGSVAVWHQQSIHAAAQDRLASEMTESSQQTTQPARNVAGAGAQVGPATTAPAARSTVMAGPSGNSAAAPSDPTSFPQGTTPPPSSAAPFSTSPASGVDSTIQPSATRPTADFPTVNQSFGTIASPAIDSDPNSWIGSADGFGNFPAGLRRDESGNWIRNYHAAWQASGIQSYGNGEARFDVMARQLAAEYLQANGEQREVLRHELTRVTEMHFDARQQSRREEVESLEKRLNDIKERLESREKLRSQIVAQRVDQLLGEDDLQWDEGTTSNPAQTGFGTAQIPLPPSPNLAPAVTYHDQRAWQPTAPTPRYAPTPFAPSTTTDPVSPSDSSPTTPSFPEVIPPQPTVPSSPLPFDSVDDTEDPQVAIDFLPASPAPYLPEAPRYNPNPVVGSNSYIEGILQSQLDQPQQWAAARLVYLRHKKQIEETEDREVAQRLLGEAFLLRDALANRFQLLQIEFREAESSLETNRESLERITELYNAAAVPQQVVSDARFSMVRSESVLERAAILRQAAEQTISAFADLDELQQKWIPSDTEEPATSDDEGETDDTELNVPDGGTVLLGGSNVEISTTPEPTPTPEAGR